MLKMKAVKRWESSLSITVKWESSHLGIWHCVAEYPAAQQTDSVMGILDRHTKNQTKIFTTSNFIKFYDENQVFTTDVSTNRNAEREGETNLHSYGSFLIIQWTKNPSNCQLGTISLFIYWIFFNNNNLFANYKGRHFYRLISYITNPLLYFMDFLLLSPVTVSSIKCSTLQTSDLNRYYLIHFSFPIILIVYSL